MTTAELTELVVERLHQAEDPTTELFDLPPALAAGLARQATHLANTWGGRDPMLGSGRDTRAVYALALGLVTGAGIMYDVMHDLQGG